MVQDEFRKRRGSGKPDTCKHTFSSKIICGEFGGTYGAKTWRTTKHGNRSSLKIWQFNEKYREKGRVNCQTPHLTDIQAEYAFVTAFNMILNEKERYIADYELIIDTITNTFVLENEMESAKKELEEIFILVKNCIDKKARCGYDPALVERHNKIIEKYDSVKSMVDNITNKIDLRSIKRPKSFISLRKSSHRAIS